MFALTLKLEARKHVNMKAQKYGQDALPYILFCLFCEWSDFVSTWVELQRKNGSVDLLFEHWIRGGGAKSVEPRWSIIRDVLHWVE